MFKRLKFAKKGFNEIIEKQFVKHVSLKRFRMWSFPVPYFSVIGIITQKK